MTSADKFTFTTADGHTVTIPHLKHIKAGIIRRLRGKPVEEQFFGMLEALAADDALAVIDDMQMDEFGRFLDEWQESSGVSLGESPASSTSSTNTGRPSSTTSSEPDSPSTS